MKIVIADDERLARVSLRSMIEDMKIEDCTISECRNGRELAELVTTLKPQVVFVDIKMPLLNGLEAIEECKHLSNVTQFVLTTGFSEFEYAKKAIELGVYDYLLKPIEPEKLSEVIKEIIKENRKSLYERNLIFNNNTIELVYSNYFSDKEIFKKFSYKKSLSVCLFYLDNNLDNNQPEAVWKQILKVDEEIISDIIYDNINIAKLNLENNLFVFILCYEDEHFNKVERYITKIREAYRGKMGLHLTTVNEIKIQNIECLRSSIEDLKRYGTLRVILGIEKDYNIDELISQEIDEGKYILSRTIESISSSLKNKVYSRFCEELDKLERILINDKNILKDDNICSNVNLFLNRTINFNYEDKFSSNWFARICEYRNEFEVGFNRNKDITEKIMEFIDKNYMFEISISILSERFNLTANYISSLFHKKTKMRLVNYIAKVRIAKAQSLLVETELNVKDISKAVGYYSVRHFTKLFKNITGVTPSEYKKLTQDKNK